MCQYGNASGMMILFGGRGIDNNSFNDTWGLRRHRDGSWDWVKAPYKNKNTDYLPVGRFQHTLLFYASTMLIIGGRSASSS